jgi:D-sedoheptulose 7-phosphate isomerase
MSVKQDLDFSQIFQSQVDDHQAVFQKTIEQCDQSWKKLTEIVCKAIEDGKTIFFIGNGGSAATASHMAGELIGRYRTNREPIASLVLHDASINTCIANDFGYDEVFSRQLKALVKDGDIVIALSTSGNSPNVIGSAPVIKDNGGILIGITGESGGKLKDVADHMIQIPSKNTARIQEMTDLLLHTMCEVIEQQRS